MVLLQAKADINAQDQHVPRIFVHMSRPTCATQGFTPLYLAASYGRPPVVLALLQAGADVHIRTNIVPCACVLRD
jgi:hypothetical protein